MSANLNIEEGSYIPKRRDGQVQSAIGTYVNLGGPGSGSVRDLSLLLASMLEVDGAGSGLDADLLDGQHGSYYAPVANPVLTGSVELSGIAKINSTGFGVGNTNPLRKMHLTQAAAGPSTIAAFEDTNTTNGNGPVVSFRGTTTGAGGAAFQELAGFQAVFAEHNHATRRGDFMVFATLAGVEKDWLFKGNGDLEAPGNISIAAGNFITAAGNGGWYNSEYECSVDCSTLDGGGNLRLTAKAGRTVDFISSARPWGDLYHPDFASGFQGDKWKIWENGNAEFANLAIRGGLTASEMIINVLKYQNGGQIFGPGSGKVKTIVVNTVGEEQVRFEDPEGNEIVPFSAGALVLIQKFDLDRSTAIKKIVRVCMGIGIGGEIGLGETAGWDPDTDDVGVIEPGDELVVFGNTSDSTLDACIYLSVVDSGSPFLRVMDGVDSYAKWMLSDKSAVKLQLGNLSALAGYDIVPASPGYGLYCNNVYLSGKIVSVVGSIGGFLLANNGLSNGNAGESGYTLLKTNGLCSFTSYQSYDLSQQSASLELTIPIPRIVSLDNNVESTLYLPDTDLPGSGTSTWITIIHAYGTGLGAGKYHINGNGYYINRGGVRATSVDIDEGGAITLYWDPRQGGQWYAA